MPADSASSSSSVYVNTIPPATQIVPSVGLDGKPTKSASPSEDNGGDTFPTAAIVVIAIVGALVFLFVAYFLYKRCYKRCRDSDDDDGPAEHHLPGALSPGGAGGFMSLPSQMSMAYPGVGSDSMGRRSMSNFGLAGAGRSRQASWGGESWGGAGWGEKGDLTPSPPFAGTPNPPGSPSSREGSPGPGGANGSRGSLPLPNSSTRNSLAPGGSGPGMPRRSFYSSSATGSQLLHFRAASFSSSPLLGGSSGPGSMHFFPSGNRLAGAPHSPHSRIEVIPPLPLAPPPGQVIATDKSTIDFALSSGTGRGGVESEFLGLVDSAGRAVTAGGDIEERLNPAFDGSYTTTYQGRGGYPQPPYAHQAGQHSFPPSAPSFSSAGSSRSSSAPRAGPSSRKPSSSNLRQQASQPQLARPAAVRAAAAAGATPGPSANSSASTLSSGSASGSSSSLPAGAAPPRPRPAVPSINTSTASLPPSAGEGPKSPLEALQARVEREARGLSLRQEEVERIERVRQAEREGR
ncbi:hypothetical protein JCM8097_007692 [Rhodosporidiobolus ruineniae]